SPAAEQQISKKLRNGNFVSQNIVSPLHNFYFLLPFPPTRHDQCLIFLSAKILSQRKSIRHIGLFGLHFANSCMFAGIMGQGAQEATMLNVTCPHCQQTFLFDPAKIWTSPGGITNLKGGTKVVVQCEKCKQWLILELSITKLDEKPNQEG